MWAGCCSTDKHCHAHNPDSSQLRIYRKPWQQLQRNVSVALESLCVLKTKISTGTWKSLFVGLQGLKPCATKWHFQRIQSLITSSTPDSPHKAPRGILGAFPSVCRDFQRLTEPGSAEQTIQGTEVEYPWRDWKAGDFRDLNISEDSRATGRSKESLFIIQLLCRDNSEGDVCRGIFLLDY